MLQHPVKSLFQVTRLSALCLNGTFTGAQQATNWGTCCECGRTIRAIRFCLFRVATHGEKSNLPVCPLHQRQPHRCPTGDEPGDVARSVLHSPNIVCNPLQGTRRWFKNLWFKKPLTGRFPSRQCESQSLHLSASSQRTQTTIGIRRDTTQNNRIQGRSSPQENMVTLSVVLAPPGTDEWLRLTLNWCGETSPC